MLKVSHCHLCGKYKKDTKKIEIINKLGTRLFGRGCKECLAKAGKDGLPEGSIGKLIREGKAKIL